MCFHGERIYDEDKLNQTYAIDNASKYIRFLQGNAWDDRMLNVSYDAITMSLEEYVHDISMYSTLNENGSLYTWSKNNNNNPSLNKANTTSESEATFPFYIGFRHHLTKCFSLDLSKELISEIEGKTLTMVSMALKNMRLPNIFLAYYVHYPKQLLRSSPVEIEWMMGGNIISGDLYAKLFFIDSIKVIRRRNTLRNPCNKEWKRDDDMILTKIIETAGCKPAYWFVDGNYSVCNDPEKMKSAYIPNIMYRNASFFKRFDEPCDEVQTLTFNIKDVQRGLKDNTDKGPAIEKKSNQSEVILSQILFIFKSTKYEEIRQLRAFDFESLIGNMGGYVGLFLGFAFWQAPDAINILAIKTMKVIKYLFK